MRPDSPSCWPADTGRIALAGNLDVLDRHEIAHLQTRHLAVLVAAAAATPAVRRRFPGIESVTDPAALERLPLMSPADLTTACPPQSDELLLGGHGPGLVLRSSGTSGRRKVLYHSWPFTRQVGLLGARGVRAALPDPPRRLANCNHPGELNGAFTFVQDVGQLLPALTFPLGSTLGRAEAMELISEHAIDTLAAIPAYFGDIVAEGDWPPAVRNVLYIGEAMNSGLRRALALAAPALTVRSLAYSTSETGPIGYQCPYVGPDTHHIHEDAVIVEVVDEQTGAPLADDRIGEVVATPLTDTGMALLRYRIGDRGRLRSEPCRCGSAARLLTLAGRTDQSILVDGKIVSNDLLMARLATLGIDDPVDCQLQALWDGATYELVLLISPSAAPVLGREAVAAVLSADYTLNLVVNGPRCTGLRLERVDHTGFARSARGKTPVLYERTGPRPGDGATSSTRANGGISVAASGLLRP